jgi:hypothetical protein
VWKKSRIDFITFSSGVRTFARITGNQLPRATRDGSGRGGGQPGRAP